jgi:hypothetical protein
MPGVYKHDPPSLVQKRAELALSGIKRSFDYAFWTDGSLLPSGFASAACITYATDAGDPCKRRRLSPNSITILSRPAGLTESSTLAEKNALEMPAQIINSDPLTYEHTNIFIGTDCQSGLMALAAGPLRDYTHPCTDYQWSQTYSQYMDTASELDCDFFFHYIPAHVGITPNEHVNDIAYHDAHVFSSAMQMDQPIELKSLKTAMKQSLIQRWIQTTPIIGARYRICGPLRSDLKKRNAVPRALQCLYSRWRVGEVESCGVFPRRMTWIDSPVCRYCCYPCETTFHLLTDCPGTASYRLAHGLSTDVLVCESPDNIIRVAQFDAFIRHTLGCRQWHSVPSLESILAATLNKRKTPPNQTNDNHHSPHKRQKRSTLIIPHSDLPHSTLKRKCVTAKKLNLSAVKKPKRPLRE